MLVTFLEVFPMSVYTQPTHLTFHAVKNTGNIFHPTKNRVRRQKSHLKNVTNI